MKPVSIIFLIISVILVIVGLLTCSVAMIQSKRQNIDLYDTKIENGQSESEYDFSEDVLGKIQIQVSDCDVTVICGAEDNKVVMKNFSSAGYICEVDNRSLVIEDTVNLFNISDIIENGKIRFKGFRYFLRDRKLSAGSKSLTVYISDKFDIKILDISVVNGNVNIAGYTNNTDYVVNISNGNFTASDIVTESEIKAVVGRGTVSLQSVSARSVDILLNEGNINATVSGSEISAETKKGDINIQSMNDLSKYNFVLKAPVATITLEDLVKAGNYIANDAQLSNYIHASTDNGFIVVKTFKSIEPIEPVDTSDTAEVESDTAVVSE